MHLIQSLRHNVRLYSLQAQGSRPSEFTADYSAGKHNEEEAQLIR